MIEKQNSMGKGNNILRIHLGIETNERVKLFKKPVICSKRLI